MLSDAVVHSCSRPGETLCRRPADVVGSSSRIGNTAGMRECQQRANLGDASPADAAAFYFGAERERRRPRRRRAGRGLNAESAPQ